MTLRFAFEALDLHRVEISIIPRNRASRRVVEKLGLREEGVAERFLEIDGRVGGPRPLRHDLRGLGSRGDDELLADLARPGARGPGVSRPTCGRTDGEWRKNCSTSCS